MHIGLVPVQPNFVDCGIFAILNVQIAISKVGELALLEPTPNCVHCFQYWYTVEHALNERRNLRLMYQDLLNKYTKPSDEIHVVQESGG